MESRRLAVLRSHLHPLASSCSTSIRSPSLSPSSCNSHSDGGSDSRDGSLQGDCVFCRIIQGESPAFKLYEDERCLCILDTRPLTHGHSLIIPKSHFSSLEATPPSVIAAMCSKVPFISNAIMKATGSDSFNLLVNCGAAAGQVIFHTHIHIIPRKAHDCLWASETFRRHSLTLDKEASRLVDCVREQLNVAEIGEDREPNHAGNEERAGRVRQRLRDVLREGERSKLVNGSWVALYSAEKQAERLREDGNNCFIKGRLGAAIDAYTEAITLCPTVPVYWTNRAVCHRKRNDWTKVEEDCRRAIQLDNTSVKAHYMLGLALLKKEEYPEGIKQLEKALELGRGGNRKSYIVEDIWKELAKAKYTEWELASTSRSWELQSLKEVCETALTQMHFLEYSETEGSLDEASFSHKKQLEALDAVFRKASEADIPTEVPDYLCCKITLDVLRDPVITPSGITYERAVIIDHIQKVGKFDPVTREVLHESQLVPNLGIKEAVQAFLDKHGWAYQTD